MCHYLTPQKLTKRLVELVELVELTGIEENISAKQAVRKITDKSLTEVDLAEKQIDAFKQDLAKNVFDKIVLKPDDLDRFKNVLSAMKKANL